jgi:kynureninase
MNHSLGLMPKRTVKAVNDSLSQWGDYANGAWGVFDWINLDKKIVNKILPLIGAKEEEVTVCSALTENIHKLVGTFYKPKENRNKIIALK